MNAAGDGVGLHSARGVDAVTKHAILGQTSTDNIADNRTGVESNPNSNKAEGWVVFIYHYLAGCLDGIDGELGDALDMICLLILDKVGNCKICVSNCLDLEDVMFVSKIIERSIQAIQHFRNLPWTDLLRYDGEAHDVRKEYGDAFVVFGFHLSSLSKGIGNMAGEDVIQ